MVDKNKIYSGEQKARTPEQWSKPNRGWGRVMQGMLGDEILPSYVGIFSWAMKYKDPY